MWRALFYAIGSMTILLGIQSLAFEQVQMAPGKDALQIVKRLLRDGDGGGSGALAPVRVDVPNNLGNNQPFRTASDSSFGPSRFSNGGFGGTTFSAAPYRDLTTNNGLGIGSGQSTAVPRAQLASYQTRSAQVGGTTQVGGTGGPLLSPGRVIRSKDWMPWSLLAIGALIILYTRSVGRRLVA